MENSVFDKIAEDYHLKRKKPWRPLEFFIDFLKNKGICFRGNILDLGCANGRNFKIMSKPPNKLIGIDISLQLLKIANKNLRNADEFSAYKSKFYQLIHADLVNLPIRNNSVHIIFSIATLHHIKQKSEQKRAIVHMYELLKVKGKLILTVWRKWQKQFRDYFLAEWLKRNFTKDYKIQQKEKGLEEFGDKLVPWSLSKENEVYNRFYHFFSKRELKKLLGIYRIEEFKITGGPTNRDNFFILARKA